MRFNNSLVAAPLFLVGLLGSSSSLAVPFVEGDVFAAVNAGRVYHYDNAGNYIEELNTGRGGFTTGMAFDASGNLYVTNFSDGTISKFDSSGGLVDATFVTGLATPESVVFDKNGDFYVTQVTGSTIKKYDGDGNFLMDVNIGQRSDWMDLAADQTTILYGDEGRTIFSFDVDTDSANPDFATLPGSGEAFALRILADGGVIVADGSEVKRTDAFGAVIQTYDVTGVGSWFALNLDPDNMSFWSGSFANDTFYRFDIASGALLDTVDTGLGSGNLYGLTVFGEITEGGPGPSPTPAPGVLTLVMTGLTGWWFAARKQ